MNSAALATFELLAGAVLTHFPMATHPRFITLKDAVDSQRAILEQRVFVFDGQAVEYFSWRNRILVPLAIRTFSKFAPVSFSQAYIMVRWLAACAAICAFGLLVLPTLRTSA